MRGDDWVRNVMERPAEGIVLGLWRGLLIYRFKGQRLHEDDHSVMTVRMVFAEGLTVFHLL